MILINGANDHCIPFTDRGFQYGDGLFETIEIQDGQAVFWQRHLRRLENGCRRLSIPFPDIALLSGEAHILYRNAEQAVLKIIVTRGSGGRGYRQPEHIAATRALSLHPFPQYPAALQYEGITARFCNTPLGSNPALAGLKHLNRLEQVLARAEWQDPEISEGLMLDMHGGVIEGTMSNLFIVKNGLLHTDALQQCGVAGIVREVLLEACARHGQPVALRPLPRSEVLSADAIFVTNSLIGLWPVRALEDRRFAVNCPLLRRMSAWLSEYKRRERYRAA
ncbi:MAG: aminodeoxychorismate lyase [Gammaproteobacteria bacterium]